ncbi:MAG: ankyrin repeat domain-containing protein [Alphaproteobacteria bacterium]|nr:ankyrin repeat domain-containing protein [Alphaproteobacteria bacterium]
MTAVCRVETAEEVERRVVRLQAEFAAGDAATRRRLLEAAHAKERFENFDPDAPSLSYADARLLIANQEGYAYWGKYESYLHLEPAVQRVIVAVRSGDIATLREALGADPAAANPRWIAGFRRPARIPNDSIPLFCVSEGVFRGTNRQGNEYDMTRLLVAAGADIHIEDDIVLASAISFDVIDAVAALLDEGAAIDGVDGDGVPMAYAMHFGYVAVAELLGRRGARRDLRFAAGLGELEAVKGWFEADGSLKPGAGALADPYGQEWKHRGQSPFRCERTRANILSQALCFACTHHRLEVADYLLAQGADINAIVPGLDMKATVLHRAATGTGRWTGAEIRTVVRFLLDRGADPSIRDEAHHSTPIGWASHFGLGDSVDLLIDRAGIHDAVGCDRPDRVRVLLAGDPGLATATDEDGATPLHRLHGGLTRGSEMIDLLVQHGADVNARDRNGVTVLAKVTASGAAELADRLRSLGARRDAHGARTSRSAHEF